MNCLVCTQPMTRSLCNCGGAWLSESKLAHKAAHIRGDMVKLKWERREGDQHRKCPVCASEMATVWLVGVALDRCKAHGIWFDAHELQTVLERAASLPHADAPPAPTPETFAPASRSSDSTADTVGGVFQILGALLELLG